MKILLSFTHLHVVRNLNNFIKIHWHEFNTIALLRAKQYFTFPPSTDQEEQEWDWQDFTVCNTGLIFTKTDLIIWKMISEQHVLYFLLTLLDTFLSIKVNHDAQPLYWMYPIGHQFSYLIFCRSKKLKNKTKRSGTWEWEFSFWVNCRFKGSAGEEPCLSRLPFHSFSQ